jgi:hypothetical protein
VTWLASGLALGIAGAAAAEAPPQPKKPATPEPAAKAANDPAGDWRYRAALASPANLTAFPDGKALALRGAYRGAPPTAAVGKWRGDTGAVDLFTFAQGRWSFRKRFEPRPEAKGKGQFGTTVVLAGDTLAIGAPQYEDATIHRDNDPKKIVTGYVDIYLRQDDKNDDAAWKYQQTIVPTSFTLPADARPDNFYWSFGFGSSIAVDGNDLVVGAGRFDDGIGRAFVFRLNLASGHATQIAEFKEAAERADANFGDTVRIDGDTIIVTRPDSPTSSRPGVSKAGKVYVYQRNSGGHWKQQQILQSAKASGTNAASDGFGTAAVLFGNRLVVRSNDSAVPSNDSVQVFVRKGGQQGAGKAEKAGAWSSAPAWSTQALPGDRNSIGVWKNDLVVGEPGAAANGVVKAGQVRVFAAATGNAFVLRATRAEPSPAAGRGFGTGVALVGDHLLVGAPGSFKSDANGATLDFVKAR